MNVKSIRDVENVRLAYNQEIENIINKYEKMIANQQKIIKDIRATDYSIPYITRYQRGLDSVQRIVDEIIKLESHTYGLRFSTKQLIEELQNANYPTGKDPDEYFLELASDLKGYLASFRASTSVKEDEKYKQGIISVYICLRDLVRNGSKYLDDFGTTKRDRDALLKPATEKLRKINAEYDEAMKFENMATYNDVIELKRLYLENERLIKNNLLGNKRYDPEGNFHYNIFLGTTPLNISEDNKKFLKDVCGLPKVSGSEIVTYDPRENNKALAIVLQREMKSKDIIKLVFDMYAMFTFEVPRGKLKYAAIQADNENTALLSFANFITSKLDDSFIFQGKDSIISKVDDGRAVKNYMDLVDDFCRQNSQIVESDQFSGLEVENVFDHNNHAVDNPCNIMQLFYMGYPNGFNDRDYTKEMFNKKLKSNLDNGVIPIIFVNGNSYVDPQVFDILTLCQNGTTTFNNKLIDFRMEDEETHFNPEEFAVNIQAEFKADQALMLGPVTRKYKNAIEERPNLTQTIIGLEDSKPFTLVNKYSEIEQLGIIIGGSGSGKSSFLHSYILSNCYYNSPDDIAFYLVDFKSKEEGTTFAGYKKGEINYLPHVRYLSLTSTAESATDLFNKIEKEKNERNKLFKKTGLANVDIIKYNNSEQVKNGTLPKLPLAMFIIDEYNVMLSGGSGSTDKRSGREIMQMVKNAFATVRSAGIGIILCGQVLDNDLWDVIKDNTGTRILLRSENMGYVNQLFQKGMVDEETRNFISNRGYALIRNSAQKTEYHKVRLVYSGNDFTDYCKMINEKWAGKTLLSSYPQIDAGKTEPVKFKASYLSNENEDDSNYTVTVGIGSVSNEPINLNYKVDLTGASSNYYAIGYEDKLYNIERSVIASNLYKGGEVYFYSDKGHMNELVENNYEAVTGLHLLTDAKEVGEAIMKIHREYKDRIRRKNNNRNERFKPIMFMLYNPSWLSDDRFFADLNKVDKKETAVEQSEEEKSAALQLAALGLSLDDQLAGFMRKKNTKPTEAEEVNEKLDINDIRDIMKDLFAHSIEYNIYLFFSAKTTEDLKAIISRTEEREHNNKIVQKDYSSETVSVYPEGFNTRLFKFENFIETIKELE